MDMGTTTMSMSMSTSTSTAATASSTMSMSMGSSSCKISMLWNWYTVDACFISKTWHITSSGMFAGSCIGVILLVMSLELLRRTSKEYDQYIALQAQKQHCQTGSLSVTPLKSPDNREGRPSVSTAAASLPTHFRPSIFQQAIRAGLHTLQFTVAYFIMLLAMYYNGYIIICIIIGAYLGSFVFSWETIKLGSERKGEATYCCG